MSRGVATPRTYGGNAAPRGYRAGVGRGEVGFTTRSDIGPAAGGLGGPAPANFGAAPAGYVAGAGRGLGAAMGALAKQNGEVGANLNEANFNEFSGYGGSLFSGDTPYDKDDAEADKVWQEIDDKMDERRKRRRETRRLEEMKKQRQEKPKMSDQFADLKRQLATVSHDEWNNLPDAGDHSKRRPQKRRAEVYTPVTDQMLREAAGQGQMDNEIAAKGGEASVMGGLAEARGQVMSLRLDKMADSVSGQTVVDPKGYLTDLNSVTLRSDAEVGDIKKAQLLLKSVTSTNPRHAPGWIAAARVEEYAGKIAQARRKIREGCERCPEAEDVWLEAARLHTVDNAKAILADAVKHVPSSVKIWLKAAELEADPERRKRVLRRALEIVPNSVKLWKVAIELESAADARVMLGRAVECVPHSVDMWLALARLETYENARKVLNEARTALPTEPAIWITAAKLEEAHDNRQMVAKIIARAVQALDAMEVVLDREQWLKEAEAAEDAAAVVTCDAIVKATFARGVEAEDQLATWMLDARGCLERGHVTTARALYAHARAALPGDEDLWLAAARLERDHGSATQLDEVLQQAVARCPNSEILWLMAAKHKWVTLGDVDGCRTVLQNAFAANPDSEEIWLAAAKLESESDLQDRARALLAKARERAGSARVFMKSAALERDVATGLKRSGQPEPEIAEAVAREMALLEEGLQKYPSFPKFYMMAAEALAEREPEAARARLKEGLRRCPESIPLWLLAAALERRLGDVPRARSLLDVARARSNSEPSPELYLAAMRLEREAGQPDAAEMLMARALKECPASGRLWAEAITRAPKHAQKGKIKQAMKHCNHDPYVIVAVARRFADEGKPEKARKWFVRAAALQPLLGDTWVYYYAAELRAAADARQRLQAAATGGGDGGALQAAERAAEGVMRACVTAEPRYGELWTAVSKRPEVLAERLGSAGVLVMATAQASGLAEPSIEEAKASTAAVSSRVDTQVSASEATASSSKEATAA